MQATHTSLHPAPPNSADRSRDERDIGGFLNSLARKSPKTVATYREGIIAFAAFTSQRGMPSLENITREHVESWLDSLHQKGNGPATIRLRQAALRAFFNWQISLDLRQDSPMLKIRTEPVPQKLQPHVEAVDLQQVLDSIPTKQATLQDLRDRAIVAFLGDTGVRAAELCSLDVGDLDDAGRRAIIRLGKGGKQRKVPYGKLTADYLFKYLRRRDAPGDAPLFATRSGAPMTVNGLRNVLESRFRAIGLPFHGVHGFRRGWAITMLDNGENVLNLKELAGWSSLEMCYRYTRATAEERALVQYESPMDRLNGRRGS